MSSKHVRKELDSPKIVKPEEILRAIRDRGLGGYLMSCHVDTIDGYQVHLRTSSDVRKST